MLATTTRGPKVRGTPGEDPNAAESATPPAKVVTKDLTKQPHADERPQIVAKEPPIECETVEEALELANKRNRAVFTPFGYVCPSIIRERR
jgi:hypothetical protein